MSYSLRCAWCDARMPDKAALIQHEREEHGVGEIRDRVMETYYDRDTGGQVTVPVSDVDRVKEDVLCELGRNMQNWPAYNSAHEGYAVLLEEVDELWDEVKVNQKRRDLEKMRQEAIQVAAVAMRFALDICNEKRGRR
jgi:hypothetical protein